MMIDVANIEGNSSAFMISLTNLARYLFILDGADLKCSAFKSKGSKALLLFKLLIAFSISSSLI